MRFSVI